MSEFEFEIEPEACPTCKSKNTRPLTASGSFRIPIGTQPAGYECRDCKERWRNDDYISGNASEEEGFEDE